MRAPLTRLILLAVSLAVVGCNPSENFPPPLLNSRPDHLGFITRKNARGRDYALFVPLHYNPAEKYPMIVFLHGIGEGGSDIQKPLTVGLAPHIASQLQGRGDFDFIVLFPQSADGNWGEDSQAAADVIEEITAACRAYSIDKTRISLTGLSTGGYGTFAIGAKYFYLFSALAPIVANEACTNSVAVQNLAGMNIWAYDNPVDFFGGGTAATLTAITAAGGHPQHTAYTQNGHNVWDFAYSNPALFEWLETTHKPTR